MVRTILIWPAKQLREKSEPMPAEALETELLHGLVTDLIDTMENAGGLGLSAVQIGVAKQVFVANLMHGNVRAFVNPIISSRSPEKEMMREGCLSLPGIYENVSRHIWVQVHSWNPETGQYVDERFQGLAAQIIQHEYDHLQGKLYVDRKDPGSKDRLRAHMRRHMGHF